MSSTPTSGRIAPVPSVETQFFWDAARAGELRFQRCRSCARLRHPPGPACPSCHSFDWDTVPSAGRGTLYSYLVLHHPLPPGFTEPAVVGVVELPEGVRLLANISDVDPDTLRIGEPMEVHFVEQDEGWTAPQFHRPR